MRYHHTMRSAATVQRKQPQKPGTSGQNQNWMHLACDRPCTRNMAYYRSSASLKAIRYYQAPSDPHQLTIPYLWNEEKGQHPVDNQLPRIWYWRESMSLLPEIDIFIECKYSVMDADSFDPSELLCCTRCHAWLALRETQWL
jgi:hypothetical protein